MLDVWRLSVWLLARILNLSVQASRSSFTPTTESREAKASVVIENHLLPGRRPLLESPPAGLMVFPPTVISTAVLTRIPVVSFSELRKTSLALRAK